MTGKTLRLKRFFTSDDGRVVLFPLDHGVTCGPMQGLQQMDRVIRMGVQGGVDGVVLHKGMMGFLDSVSNPLPGIFMHLSGSTQLGENPHFKVLVGTVEEALRRGADGVSVHVNLGGTREPDMLRDLGRVGEACAAWQLPLLVMVYVRGEKIPSPAPDTAIAHAARVAAELGADIIKIPAPSEGNILREITESLPVPIVVAGGSKARETFPFLQHMEKTLEAGARGVAIGRNVFQHDQPEALLGAVHRIVHHGFSAARAWEEFSRDPCERLPANSGLEARQRTSAG